MAARGKESSQGRAKKYTTRERSESFGPYSQRQDQDLPPESAKRSDWLVFEYPLAWTNQILRFSFQLLKGSVRAQQARMTQ